MFFGDFVCHVKIPGKKIKACCCIVTKRVIVGSNTVARRCGHLYLSSR